MNYKIIKLLFDPRETINKKEFLFGIIILFILAFSLVINFITNISITAFISHKGVQKLATYQIIQPFTIPYLPINFILFYSSIILAIKRVKDLNSKVWIGVLTGIFIFLFFDVTFLKTTTSTGTLSNLLGVEINNEVKNYHLFNMGIYILLGVSSIFILSILKGTKHYVKDVYNKGRLTIFQFINQLGFLLIIIFVLSILFITLFGIASNNNTLNFLNRNMFWQSIILGFTSLLIIMWYLKLVYMRLKNTTFSFLNYFLCFIVYIISLASLIVITYKVDNLNYINTYQTFFSLINIAFSFINLSLFLLDKDSKPLVLGIKKHN
ncbi:hypothetical protein HER15_03620 [Tenacibaculum mesophilum]|uniref:Uncharacterized protein n=1 Tax=Tenacibaculum mesophilum TaxID=104268 RepID=A0AAE9MJY1_9FLAO|nr:hypothetical protein [Tenacibaculum mesophilum]UTD14617.1 hypothetical protein HER15_03620 [Tenacibaculum mesophilum]GFD92793.1 hypothetical protein KUL154_15260 [Alteromonas sp. KUL154]GFE02691.1 hypothetical protein KUL156_52830 [Alteromonas sp. KUL156]